MYDKIVFGKKTVGNLLKEIHKNSNDTRDQVKALIQQLMDIVSDQPESAMVIVPLIKGYLEVQVKNDELLIKMMSIIQRIESAASSGDNSGLDISLEELKQVLEISEEYSEDLSKAKESK